jgi:hypothetical protein
MLKSMKDFNGKAFNISNLKVDKMNLVLREIYNSFFKAIRGKYKWLLILFFLWLYRVDFVAADGGGLAKALQVVTIFGMLMIVQSNRRSIINYTYTKTNGAVKSLVVLYTYALISTLWALIPTFAFFLSFQNLVLLFLLVWMFTRIDNFKLYFKRATSPESERLLFLFNKSFECRVCRVLSAMTSVLGCT